MILTQQPIRTREILHLQCIAKHHYSSWPSHCILAHIQNKAGMYRSLTLPASRKLRRRWTCDRKVRELSGRQPTCAARMGGGGDAAVKVNLQRRSVGTGSLTAFHHLSCYAFYFMVQGVFWAYGLIPSCCILMRNDC